MQASRTSIYSLLLRNLEAKGVNREVVQRIAKDLMLSFAINPSMERAEMSKRLHALGWDDIDLDYRTWELAKASFDMQDEGM